MLKKLLLVLALINAAPAFAQYQSIEDDAARLSQEIYQNGRYLSPDQRAQISQELQTIRSILYGAQPGPSRNFTCVSRDNDGANPYIIGARSGISVTRIAGANYQNANDCQSAINSSRSFFGNTLACVSRDSDGANPWSFGLFTQNNQLKKIVKSAAKTMNDCQANLATLQVQGNLAIYCTSKDNDAANPYQAASLNLLTGDVSTGTEIFSNVEQCKAFLGIR